LENLKVKISGPLALGIHWSHDASVAVCSPEGVLFSVAEERISRIKHYYGFPHQAIDTALKYLGLTGADIDYVAFSTKNVLFPQHSNYRIVDAGGINGGLCSSLKSAGRKIKQLVLPPNASGKWEEFKGRHWSHYGGFLDGLGLLDGRIKYYYIAHHRAHAASAFRLSGLKEACIITVDGKGDGVSATIYRGYPDGRMELLRSSKPEDSLGLFYQAITEALGFIPVDGEYKTMGLAALGSGNGMENPFKGIISCKDGIFRSSVKWKMRSFNRYNPSRKVPNPLASVAQTEDFKKILENISPEQFAYFAQEHFEGNMLAYAADAIKITGCDALVCAGGAMLNVKANAMIRDDLKPSSFFAFPDSADSGLAAGSAMEALYQEAAHKNSAKFRNPYMGHSFGEGEIYDEIIHCKNKHGLSVIDGSPQVIADFLSKGKVIGAFQGRLEMGPRALGNRSVLANPCSEATKDRINLILKGREWFVPFAPAVLKEDASLYWDGSTEYPYMTFAVKANDYARKVVPSVVHVDGTMRPQVVSHDSNPWFYELLKEFKKRTGVGLLINTSFNRHGLPIVGSPADAIDHLVNGWVDGLAIGKWYVERIETD